MSAICNRAVREDITTTNYDECETGDLGAYIQKWHEIADDVEQLHKIRLSASLLPLAYVQQNVKLFSELDSWLTETKQDYEELVVQPAKDVLALKRDYENVAKKWNVIHDHINQPWCKNDRYSAPIYSLLDPWASWYIYQANNGGLDWDISAEHKSKLQACTEGGADKLCVGHVLPRLDVQPIPDVLLDFSQFNVVTASTGSLVYPDITIHELRFDLESITDLNNHPKPDELPDLSDYIDSITKEIDAMKDELEASIDTGSDGSTGSTITTNLPELKTYFNYEPNISAATKQLRGMQKAVSVISNTTPEPRGLNGMNKPYQRFWDSLTLVNEDGDWKRDQKSALDCLDYGWYNCSHTEVDLMERLTRIFVRPAVLVQEDVAHGGIPRDADVASANSLPIISNCDEADWVCQSFNDQLTYPKEKWTFILPTLSGSQQPIIDEYTDNILKHTIPGIGTSSSDAQTFPYETTPDQLLPLFSKDDVINLIPEPK